MEIYDETLVLNRLIHDLHELAQAEAGQLSLQPQALPVAPLLESVVNRFDGLARERGIGLRIVLPSGLPAIYADQDRTQQILHNLLSNALHHTPAGGEIKLEAQYRGALSAVAAQANSQAPGFIEVAVADTGSGIPASEQGHVFERFWRADRARARGGGGAGLGLAIARHLVEAQGGRIGVESQVGQGSRFWFVLPTAGPLHAQADA
jgi:signal transduction histidine kinase